MMVMQTSSYARPVLRYYLISILNNRNGRRYKLGYNRISIPHWHGNLHLSYSQILQWTLKSRATRLNGAIKTVEIFLLMTSAVIWSHLVRCI